MSRQAANRELVKLLTDLVENNPSQRFSQILRNYGFVNHVEDVWINEFNLEPDTLLARIKKVISDV